MYPCTNDYSVVIVYFFLYFSIPCVTTSVGRYVILYKQDLESFLRGFSHKDMEALKDQRNLLQLKRFCGTGTSYTLKITFSFFDRDKRYSENRVRLLSARDCKMHKFDKTNPVSVKNSYSMILSALMSLAVTALALGSFGCSTHTGSAKSSTPGKSEKPKDEPKFDDHVDKKADSSTPLIKKIREKPGMAGDVAVLAGKTGLWAISINGKVKYRIFEGPVSWALVDNKLRVIWMIRPAGNEWTLELIDFEGQGQPETVLASFPGAPIDIIHDGHHLTSGDMNYAVSFALVFKDGEVNLETREGNFYFAERAERLKEAAETLAISDPKRIKALIARSKGRSFQPKVPAVAPAVATKKKVKVDTSRCESPDMCGSAEIVPGTHYWKVLTEHSCGDGCYYKKMLYDPKKKKFFCASNPKLRGDEPEDGWNAPGAGWIAPSGKAYTNGLSIFSFKTGFVAGVKPVDEKKRIPDSGRVGGGWLEGGWRMEK